MNTRHAVLALLVPILPACRPDKPAPPGDDPPPPDSGDSGDSGTPGPVSWALSGTHPGAALMGVDGRSASDVWAVGADDGLGGLILHFDGFGWSRIPNTDRHDLWWVEALPGGTVLAAGAGGTILQGDAAGFTRMVTPALGAQTVFGVWAAAPDDAWAVGGTAGRNGFIWRWDGATWSELPLPDAVPVTPDGELPGFFKVWGRGPDDVTIVGTHGTILHWDGAEFRAEPAGTDELLFTVHGDDTQRLAVGTNVVLQNTGDGWVDIGPPGAGIVQGVCAEPDGGVLIAGASGGAWVRSPAGEWSPVLNASGTAPESLHAAWTSPEGLRWAVGGAVLSGTLDAGVIVQDGLVDTVWEPEPVEVPPVECDLDVSALAPDGSAARRWNEMVLQAIRRDIPRPGVHARNLWHTSVAMWDAWAAYDDVADPYFIDERVAVPAGAEREAARAISIAVAAHRVATHRYRNAIGGPNSLACMDELLVDMGIDPADTATDGDGPIALGNRIGFGIVARYADDGANEANDYADTTGWVTNNPPLVVDRPGVTLPYPDEWQIMNIAVAETQNGIVLDSGLQGYIGPNWGWVEPFALGPERVGTYAYLMPGAPPSVADADAKEQAMDVLRKHALLDPSLPVMMDASPGAYGNNPLGTDAGTGTPLNPVTGQPYAPNVVPVGDFMRVLAEIWADGPKSETPPGHWNSIANKVSDELDASGDLVVAETGRAVDRLGWDVHLYFGLNSAMHDAAVAAWGVKRETLGPRPISWIRWMADNGQSSDPSLPAYHPDGLPLEEGVTELITEESSAPGERHHHLRWWVGEVAVRSWPGEPGDRANQHTGVRWMRARDWIPYQRRTFVTPAFPGYVSGHSTFSRAGAEVLTRLTGSPYFPGGFGEFVAPAGATLIFEDGPSVEVRLQWALYTDAADQAGQSRRWGGIHIYDDDYDGRLLGYAVGNLAADAALPWFVGTARAD